MELKIISCLTVAIPPIPVEDQILLPMRSGRYFEHKFSTTVFSGKAHATPSYYTGDHNIVIQEFRLDNSCCYAAKTGVRSAMTD